MRTEPRSMTLADAMALSAGVAATLATSPFGYERFSDAPSYYSFAYASCFLGQCLCFVILWRQARYRRPVRPAEWLAFVAVAGLQARYGAGNNLDEYLSRIEAGYFQFGGTYDRWRLASAIAGIAVIVGGLAALRLLRSILPGWSKTLGLFALAVVAIWDPLWVISVDGVDLLVPEGGFSSATASILLRALCAAVVALPEGLLFGVPLAAMLSERRRTGRPRAWTEHVAPVALSSWIWSTLMDPGAFPPLSAGWMAERTLHVLYLIGVVSLGRVIDRRLGARWRDSIDGRPAWALDGHDRASASPSSIR